jgi:CheY-like chemotaxis protein
LQRGPLNFRGRGGADDRERSRRAPPFRRAPQMVGLVTSVYVLNAVPCKGCILVVDDDPAIREALTECFEELGCSVTVAVDGRDALDALERCPPPCFALLDLNMPRLDGEGLARIVRADDCRHRSLPIVTMSAGRDRLSSSIVHSHVEKPFSFEALAPTIEQLCHDPDWLHGKRCARIDRTTRALSSVSTGLLVTRVA